MNKENASKLWKIIQEAGDYLVGQLPDHPNHPKGRNPYAHVAICVKSKFNASYKDIPDEKFDEVTLSDARKSLEFVTAVYDSSRQNKNIKLPIEKNNPLYNSWLPK